MLELDFGGWFECRLATDPDPFDEPRGVSGTTFACPGEPDLDRVIRFGPRGAGRRPGPEVGVRVTGASREGRAVEHPLTGAAVRLVGAPRFEGRNGLLGTPGTEVIDPFELAVEGAGVRLGRRDRLDAQDGSPLEAAPDAPARRAGGGIERGVAVSAEIARATGIEDFLEHRLARAEAIERALAAARSAGDRVGAAGFERRRAALGAVARMRVSYAFAVGEWGGAGWLEGDLPGPAVDLDAPWPLRFWMGAWDGDALCGFVSGRLGLAERVR
ncbi:MAG: hypothetical protein QOF77_1616 [Solirubrobacteraceae bacterium]|jgi:hypothetical protein|nr:hypothetical protein [Solirubrobacteraceae bacterium]